MRNFDDSRVTVVFHYDPALALHRPAEEIMEIMHKDVMWEFGHHALKKATTEQVDRFPVYVVTHHAHILSDGEMREILRHTRELEAENTYLREKLKERY